MENSVGDKQNRIHGGIKPHKCKHQIAMLLMPFHSVQLCSAQPP